MNETTEQSQQTSTELVTQSAPLVPTGGDLIAFARSKDEGLCT